MLGPLATHYHVKGGQKKNATQQSNLRFSFWGWEKSPRPYVRHRFRDQIPPRGEKKKKEGDSSPLYKGNPLSNAMILKIKNREQNIFMVD